MHRIQKWTLYSIQIWGSAPPPPPGPPPLHISGQSLTSGLSLINGNRSTSSMTICADWGPECNQFDLWGGGELMDTSWEVNSAASLSQSDVLAVLLHVSPFHCEDPLSSCFVFSLSLSLIFFYLYCINEWGQAPSCYATVIVANTEICQTSNCEKYYIGAVMQLKCGFFAKGSAFQKPLGVYGVAMANSL